MQNFICNKSRKLVAVIVADEDQVLFISVKCWKHQAHLQVRSGLMIADDFLKATHRNYGYFGSLATLVNSWREVGSAVYDAALSSVDSLAHAIGCCNSLPSRCISGRWLSVSGTELSVQRFGAGALQFVFFSPIYFVSCVFTIRSPMVHVNGRRHGAACAVVHHARHGAHTAAPWHMPHNCDAHE